MSLPQLVWIMDKICMGFEPRSPQKKNDIILIIL